MRLLKSQFGFKKSEYSFLNLIFPVTKLEQPIIKLIGEISNFIAIDFLFIYNKHIFEIPITNFWLFVFGCIIILILNWVIYIYTHALEILYVYVRSNQIKLWTILIVIPLLCVVIEQMRGFDKGTLAAEILNIEMLILYIVELICIWKLMIDIVINKDKLVRSNKNNKNYDDDQYDDDEIDKNNKNYNNDKNKLIVIAVLISIQITYFVSMMYSVVRIYPDAFSGGGKYITNFTDVVYFVIVTYTTLGYGDILPTTNLAKFIVCIISITSFMTNIIVIGEIINVYNGNKPIVENEDDDIKE